MIEYLKNGKVPYDYEKPDVEALIERASDYYLENHRLRQKHTNRTIPTILERKKLLHSVHDHKGHRPYERLLEQLEVSYYWPTMRTDC